MNIEIAKHSRMTESGSSLLRLIQNNSIPLMDLFVRESIQNALDAAKPNEDFVKVNIINESFNAEKLNEHFEGIKDSLNRKFSGDNNRYIAIADSNTTGLTGPVNYEEVRDNNFGNLLKLVYEICKPQQNEGAGGSWGLGKTIYYRMGIGLVIYYSRIFQDGRYQSRLAACLVEDETKNDSLIPDKGGVKRGIAWWGKKKSALSDETVPVEDEEEISKILSVFGIQPYEGKKTGTIIIIPYVNEKKLLNEAYAVNEEYYDKPYWVNSLPSYFEVAIQRWYSPRLLNRQYRYGPYLKAFINREKILRNDMLSVFRIIRELYITATCERIQESDTFSEKQIIEIKREKILIRKSLETTDAGTFAYVKVNKDQLLMSPPNNQRNPYQQITNLKIPMETGNNAIVLFTRKPGMIVGYDYNGQWTHRTPKTAENEYIIGLFVANSENSLKDIDGKITGKPLSLEEYIRQGEKADHASWTDRTINGNNPKIISRIQSGVIKQLQKEFREQEKGIPDRIQTGLSRVMANLLLPPENFGHSPSQPRGGGSSNDSGGRITKNRISTGITRFEKENVITEYQLSLVSNEVYMYFSVKTDSQKYDAETWESEKKGIGKPFPIEISEILISDIQTSGKRKNRVISINQVLSPLNSSIQMDNFDFDLIFSDKYSVPSAMKVTVKDGNKYRISGKIRYTFTEKEVMGEIDVKEDKK